MKLRVITVSEEEEEEIWAQIVGSICRLDGSYEEHFAVNCRPTSSNHQVIKSRADPDGRVF